MFKSFLSVLFFILLCQANAGKGFFLFPAPAQATENYELDVPNDVEVDSDNYYAAIDSYGRLGRALVEYANKLAPKDRKVVFETIKNHSAVNSIPVTDSSRSQKKGLRSKLSSLSLDKLKQLASGDGNIEAKLEGAAFDGGIRRL